MRNGTSRSEVGMNPEYYEPSLDKYVYNARTGDLYRQEIESRIEKKSFEETIKEQATWCIK